MQTCAPQSPRALAHLSSLLRTVDWQKLEREDGEQNVPIGKIIGVTMVLSPYVEELLRELSASRPLRRILLSSRQGTLVKCKESTPLKPASSTCSSDFARC